MGVGIGVDEGSWGWVRGGLDVKFIWNNKVKSVILIE